MITSAGKTHIKRYLAGYTPTMVRSMGFGVGNKAVNAADRWLNMEVGRSGINVIQYAFENDRIIFKASVPDTFEGTLYEVGLYSQEANSEAGDYGSRSLLTFASDAEQWVGSTEPAYTTANTRIGMNSLTQTPATGTSRADTLMSVGVDLSGYSSEDQFILALNAGNGNGSVKVTFIVDEANYYTYNLGAQTSGYKILSFNKGAATVTGSPTWQLINQVKVETTASGGAASIAFDGLRIEDTDTINLDYILVGRKVLDSPITKVAGQPLDVEIYWDVVL